MIPEGRLNPDGTIDVPTFDAKRLRYLRSLRLGAYVALMLGDLLGLGLVFLIAAVAVTAVTSPLGAVAAQHWQALQWGRALADMPTWAMRPVAAVMPIFLAIAIQRKPYSARFLIDPERTTRDTLSALITASAAVVLVVLRADVHIWRSVGIVGIGTLLGAAWLLAWREAATRLTQDIFQGRPIAMIAIVDDIMVDLPHDFPTLFAGVAGLRPDRNDPVALAALADALTGAERVIVACSPERRPQWLEVLKGANVQGEFILPEVDSIGMLRTSRVGPHTTAVVSLGAIDTTNRIVKRAFDLSIALAALMVLWPVLLVTAIAVRLDSPGPILFRQPRVGRANRLFSVYKFRSMRTDLCDTAGDTSTARGDARITRVGGFIRKTSIDELPQIFNVLNGTMSIVGPRPHAVASKAAGRMFWEVDESYWHRHAVKPGITGLAQVSGWRGATETEADLTNRVAADNAYMLDWSLWRDIGIILRTLKVVFHKNAY
jgi:lipopolysaccharide/colanic/teichoic acid biosynthesis glycosyltransferase